MQSRLKTLLGLAIVSFVLYSAPAKASGYRTDHSTTPDKAHRAAQLNDRLQEIRAMKLKELPRAERKALRAEVKEIKHELAEISGGVYLSVGAIILIALLILLLA